MTYVSTVAECLSQWDVPQTAHLAAAAIAYRLGKRAAPPERALLWLLWAGLCLLLGWLGFRFGVAAEPLSYNFESDARLWRPVPGLIELRTIDHAIHLAMGCFFLAASAAAVALKRPWPSPDPTAKLSIAGR